MCRGGEGFSAVSNTFRDVSKDHYGCHVEVGMEVSKGDQ